MIIYDYVDLNVAMLENMYHKRLAGYREIGYEIRIDAKSKQHGILYDKSDYRRVLDDDFLSAKQSALIVSPSLSPSRVTQLLRVYESMINRPRVKIVTRRTIDENASRQAERLRNAGMIFSEYDELHLRCAVIDESLVWYGSINPIGYANDTDSLLRFDSGEIAKLLAKQFD